MKKTYTVFSIVIYLFVSLIPLNVNAQDQNLSNNNDNEEVTTETTISETNGDEEITIEETEEGFNEIIEVPVSEVVNTEVQTVAKNARVITYPATIASIFPDPKLAQGIAGKLQMQVTDRVTKARLDSIRHISTFDMENKVTNLAGIDELGGLISLSLFGHEITDYSNVDWSRMPVLSALYISGNNLTDLSSIDWSKFVQLEYLDLSTNALDDEDMRAIDWSLLSDLKFLGVTSNFICDLNSIDWAKLPLLEDVEFTTQRHILPDVNYSNPLVVENPAFNHLGNHPPVIYARENGTYDATTNKVTWNLTTTNEIFITFIWAEDVTINGVDFKFAGTGMFTVREAYQVVFKDWDGTIIKDENLSAGAAITPPANPTRSGYSFAGWTPTVATTMPTNNLEYTATYTKLPASDYYIEESYQVPNTGVK